MLIPCNYRYLLPARGKLFVLQHGRLFWAFGGRLAGHAVEQEHVPAAHCDACALRALFALRQQWPASISAYSGGARLHLYNPNRGLCPVQWLPHQHAAHNGAKVGLRESVFYYPFLTFLSFLAEPSSSMKRRLPRPLWLLP